MEQQVKYKSRTTKFTGGAITVGMLLDALSEFPRDCELIASSADHDSEILYVKGVSDNLDWGNDNECAIVEVRPRKLKAS